MSAALSTILLNIPWMTVIENAPKVFQGATELFKLAKKKSSSKVPSESALPNESPQDDVIASLQSRSIELETTVADLNDKMLAASELIKELAEQNAQLINRIETNRQHILWLSLVVVAVVIAVIFSLVSK